MYIIYVDEYYEKDAQYMLLGAFILPISKWKKLDDNIKELKQEFFDNYLLNLKLIRRKNYDDDKNFKRLSEERQKEFNERLYSIFQDENFVYMTVLIDTKKMKSKDKSFFFHLAYSFLIQRYYYFLSKKRSHGIVIMDKAEIPEVKNLSYIHRDLLRNGVPFRKVKEVFKIGGVEHYFDAYERQEMDLIAEDLIFLDDNYCIPLQIVDMICSAISAKYNRNKDYYFNKILKNIHKSNEGKIEGYGIKIFPS